MSEMPDPSGESRPSGAAPIGAAEPVPAEIVPATGEPRVTRPEDRVSFEQRLALGIGAIPFQTGAQLLQTMCFPIFQLILGMDAILLGAVLFITRFWDAITDPMMGFISDNFRSRFGRRRPFIVLGAVLMAVVYVSIWFIPKHWSKNPLKSPNGKAGTPVATATADSVVPSKVKGAETVAANASTVTTASNRAIEEKEWRDRVKAWLQSLTWRDWAMFCWLLVGGILFYTAFTIYSVPIMGLSYEMTPDYHERTRVMAWWGVLAMVGNILIGSYYPLTERKSLFDDPVSGALYVSLGIGLLIFIGLGILPGLFVKERLYRAVSIQEKIKFFPALKQTISSRNMLALLAMSLSLAFVGAMASALAVYIVIYGVCGGNREFGSALNMYNGWGYQIVGWIAVPVLTWLGIRYGKKKIMMLVLAMAALGGVAKWFIFTPNMPWLLLADPLLSGPIWVAISILVPSMMADLCDVDEYEHGQRREGMYGSVFTFCQKVGYSLTFLFTGIAVTMSGFKAELGVNQPAGTMDKLQLCFAGFSFLAPALGLGFLFLFNVTEKRAYEVRRLLEARRGKAWAEG